jgi:C-terminal processing protease CtpA/Prc
MQGLSGVRVATIADTSPWSLAGDARVGDVVQKIDGKSMLKYNATHVMVTLQQCDTKCTVAVVSPSQLGQVRQHSQKWLAFF